MAVVFLMGKIKHYPPYFTFNCHLKEHVRIDAAPKGLASSLSSLNESGPLLLKLPSSNSPVIDVAGESRTIGMFGFSVFLLLSRQDLHRL